MTRTLVVVGHGMVGHRLVDRLRSLDTSGDWRFVVLAEEAHPAYNRMALSSYLTGRTRNDLALADRAFLDDPRVDLRLACPAVSADRGARTVLTAHGEHVPYDALVLATGSRPFVPPVPGRDAGHCFVYRTFDDLDGIRRAARRGLPAVVVGGGLLGLEAAHGLSRLGMRPHVVESAPHPMPTQLDAGAARVLHRGATELGLDLRCRTAVASIEAHPEGTVGAVRLTDGTVLDCALLVFAAGVRPRDELAAALGLERGDRGGIVVDEYCRTTDERIWAVGECAAVQGRCHGLVAPGYRMADTVARRLAGHPVEAVGVPDTSTELKLLGVHVATFGTTDPAAGRAVEIVFAEDTTRYAKVFLQHDTGSLLGGVLAGDTGSRAELGPLVGRRPPAHFERLLLP
ncbi:NAD(P)/FAD-dependent oxidoreductase [Streptomyces tailanensis]|uniref:NAD(P)/FAD-dependent oxidoreductase n=1 Tax=Streptomyces tailanensis TaxID=2569858 RepID=UPI00122E9294|nr:FAD-dependent oxidoreductase [Streptomyces tailanensis]